MYGGTQQLRNNLSLLPDPAKNRMPRSIAIEYNVRQTIFASWSYKVNAWLDHKNNGNNLRAKHFRDVGIDLVLGGATACEQYGHILKNSKLLPALKYQVESKVDPLKELERIRQQRLKADNISRCILSFCECSELVCLVEIALKNSVAFCNSVC